MCKGACLSSLLLHLVVGLNCLPHSVDVSVDCPLIHIRRPQHFGPKFERAVCTTPTLDTKGEEVIAYPLPPVLINVEFEGLFLLNEVQGQLLTLGSKDVVRQKLIVAVLEMCRGCLDKFTHVGKV